MDHSYQFTSPQCKSLGRMSKQGWACTTISPFFSINVFFFFFPYLFFHNNSLLFLLLVWAYDAALTPWAPCWGLFTRGSSGAGVGVGGDHMRHQVRINNWPALDEYQHGMAVWLLFARTGEWMGALCRAPAAQQAAAWNKILAALHRWLVLHCQGNMMDHASRGHVGTWNWTFGPQGLTEVHLGPSAARTRHKAGAFLWRTMASGGDLWPAVLW